MGSFWTGIWNEGDAGPAPDIYGTLIHAEALHQTGLIKTAPIGDIATEARRVRALAARDCSRSGRGQGPYWDDNAFKLAARVHCIPESSIGQERGPRLQQVDHRKGSVGSDRINSLTPDTAAWREEGHCQISRVSMESCEHLYLKCPAEDLSRAGASGIAAFKNTRSGLPPGERALSELLLEYYNKVDTGWHWGTSCDIRNFDYELRTRSLSASRIERLMPPVFVKSDN